MLERYHIIFRRAGAGLDAADRARLAEIAERLADARHRRSARTCSPTSRPAPWSSTRGRPRRPARAVARGGARGGAGARPARQHVITLSRSSVEPFLQFSPRRDLREKAFRAWIARGDGGGETDNKAIIAEMVRAARRAGAAARLRRPMRRYRLDDAMAKTPEAVRGLLDKVWAPARARALADRDAMQELIRAEGGNFALAAWDWRYYAEKLRKVRCDLDEGEIKPYLPLERMIEAAFDTAQRLFGLTFTPRARRAGLASGRAGLGGERPRRAPCRPVLRRLFRPRLQAQRRLDDDAARPGEARRRDPAAGRQRDELRQGRATASRRCSPSTTPAPCSTSSATRCTGCCRTSPIR